MSSSSACSPPLLSTRLPSGHRLLGRRQLLLFSSSSASFLSLLPRGSSAGIAPAERVFDPVTESERAASLALSRRISEALRLLDLGRDLQSQGNFTAALNCFTQVVKDYKEFAFTEYARVGRAFALYEVGEREQAITEMEDVSISLKGYPEIHAALAAALYADKHAALLAENQFTIATVMDPHYTDVSYAREIKHWPPSLLNSLHLFLTLS